MDFLSVILLSVSTFALGFVLPFIRARLRELGRLREESTELQYKLHQLGKDLIEIALLESDNFKIAVSGAPPGKCC
jgi:hypothetical protein